MAIALACCATPGSHVNAASKACRKRCDVLASGDTACGRQEIPDVVADQQHGWTNEGDGCNPTSRSPTFDSCLEVYDSCLEQCAKPAAEDTGSPSPPDPDAPAYVAPPP